MSQSMSSQLQKKPIQTQKTRLSVPAFLLKTYEMIEIQFAQQFKLLLIHFLFHQNKEYQDIVCWNNDGQSFVIKNINEFSERVLSNYFKHNNFASFVRQLNMYDFHKIRNENNETEFRHRLFQRGNKNMLIEIKRKSGENAADDQSEQGQMSSIDMMEMERIKKDYNLFLSEVMNIKQKYTEQERIIHQMAASIERMYSEKQQLQSELSKFREEQQQTNEKLFYLQSYLLMGTDNIQNGNQPGSESAINNLKKYQQGGMNLKFEANSNGLQNNNNNNNMFGNNNGNNNNNNHNHNHNNNNNNHNNNNNNTNQKLSQLLSQANFGQYGNNLNNGGNNNNNNNNNNNLDNPYGQGKANNLNSSFHSIGENESINSSSNHAEHRITKKQDWASVSQLNKDGENIPVCPLPFVQKKKERNQICEKKITNLVNIFKAVDLKNIQKPDLFSNYLRDALSSGKNIIPEDTFNTYGGQGKKLFNSGSNSSGRQNLSMFESNTFKKLCGNNNLNLTLGITDGSEKHDISNSSLMQQFNNQSLLGSTSGGQNGGSSKQIQLSLQTNFNSNNGNSSTGAGNQGATGLYSPSYFNNGESSPRLPFNLYPSPNPNNGNQNNNFGSNFQGNNQTVLQNFLTSPSPNMSPLLLREMEEFISQQNVPQLPFGLSSNIGNNTVGNNNNNIENNRRLANDLLTSFKSEVKTEADSLSLIEIIR